MRYVEISHKSEVKIVILSDLHPNIELGGGGAIAYEFHENLKRLGIRSEFWYTIRDNVEPLNRDSSEFSFDYKESRVKLIRKVSAILGPIMLARILLKAIRNRPSAIWIHQIGNRIPFLVIPLLRILRIKTLISIHDYLSISQFKITAQNPASFNFMSPIELNTDFTLYQKLRRSLNITFINSARTKVSVSDLQSRILESQGIEIDYVIPNGVGRCEHDIIHFESPKDIRNVLFAGRLNGKGLDILCKAIIESDQHWVLNLAGNDDLEHYCRVNYPGIDFVFHGKLERIALCKLIHHMDLVSVLSQYFDPYPTISLEAAAHGTFFITTPCSGTSSLLSEGSLGEFIVPVSKVPALDKIFEISLRMKGQLEEVTDAIPTPQAVTAKYLKILQ